nr:acyl-CoA reductase [Moraxella osloensis]
MNQQINVLVPLYEDSTPKNSINDFLRLTKFKIPFQEDILKFIKDFSNSLLKNTQVKQYPDLVSLAFWMRSSNLTKIKSQFEDCQDNIIKVARGLVFHIAPSNVDTIFIYSLFLSLALGNRNIVRLSSKRTDRQQILLNTLNNLISKSPTFSDYIMIVNYEHDDAISRYISSFSKVRMIWGGDNTVEKISNIPSNSHCLDIKFSNKYSYAIIDSSSLHNLTESEWESLIKNFINDSYWFGQQACSSPRTVIWLNADKHENIINDFWNRVQKSVKSFNHEISDADIVNKLLAEQSLMIELTGIRCNETQTNLVSRLQIPNLSKESKEHHCGSGLFFEYFANNYIDIVNSFQTNDQTISYYGIDKNKLIEALNLYPNGIDRIVPFGQALSFNYIWDGYNFLNYLTRDITYE